MATLDWLGGMFFLDNHEGAKVTGWCQEKVPALLKPLLLGLLGKVFNTELDESA